MNKFIIAFLLIATVAIVAVNFVLGFFRRLFGLSPKSKNNASVAMPKDVLYDKDGTTVLRGDAHNDKTP